MTITMMMMNRATKAAAFASASAAAAAAEATTMTTGDRKHHHHPLADTAASAATSADVDAVALRKFLETAFVTVLVTCVFVVVKTTLDRLRMRESRAVVVVVGAGPTGLAAALVAAGSGRASRVIVYEERGRRELTGRGDQVALNARSVQFLRAQLGVDVERWRGGGVDGSRVPDGVVGGGGGGGGLGTPDGGGLWLHQCFVTRTGILLEHLLDAIDSRRCCDAGVDAVPIDVRLETKVRQVYSLSGMEEREKSIRFRFV